MSVGARSFPRHLVLAVLAAAAMASCSARQRPQDAGASAGEPAAPRTEPLRAAWIYSGPVSDAGWSFAHDQGRRAVEAALGDRVRTTYVENVPAGPDAERVLRDLVAQGNTLVFATSIGFADAVKRVARDHPEVRFEQATGDETAPNLRVYDHRLYEAAYLAGIVAGGMTRTHVLGFVASFPIPEVLLNVNAFTLGARSVDPRVRTKVVWIRSWFDPPRATQAAESLMGEGADVLLQNTDSPAVLVAAAKAGKYAFGWDSDMSAFAPKAHLASCALSWGRYYRRAVGEALDGTWKTGVTRWGVAEGANDLVKVADVVPADVREKVRLAREALVARPGAVFQGPLQDNAGNEVLAKDVVADERWKREMTFLVQGVEGTVPPMR